MKLVVNKKTERYIVFSDLKAGACFRYKEGAAYYMKTYGSTKDTVRIDDGHAFASSLDAQVVPVEVTAYIEEELT